MPLAHFYDIESLTNVFTICIFKPDVDEVDAYYLSDDPGIVPDDLDYVTKRIHEKNFNFQGNVNYYDLHEPANNVRLAETFSCSDAEYMNNPNQAHYDSYGGKYRIACDTDVGFDDKKYPYIFGYNSFNYDTTMMAMYLENAMVLIQKKWNEPPVHVIEPPTAAFMRQRNDELFTSKFKDNMPDRLLYGLAEKGWGRRDYTNRGYLIRKNMLMSGRHLDIARLNEKARKVGLKRLLGMMGGQILESKKLKPGQNSIENPDQFADLIAYNVSDVVQLKYKLWDNGFYQAQFTLKKSLLTTYPELVYERRTDIDPKTKKPYYAANVSPYTVRRDRLCIDSSSAQLATKALCPYEHLHDIPTVSFMYPHEEISKQTSIPRVNVLDEAKKFFYSHFEQPDIRARFDRIYDYYKNIEGKNFNESRNYDVDFNGTNQYVKPMSLSSLPKTDTTLPYFYKDGTPSSCFVVFSTGGIHGAEYNEALFKNHMEQYDAVVSLQDKAKEQYPDPIDLKKAKHVEIDGVKYPAGTFLKSGSTLKASFYKDLSKKRPSLWKEKDGAMTLNQKYAFTSADQANHEDFTSYYPNLLRTMRAFWNSGLGYDRYADIFDQKQDYGVLMKPKNKDVMSKNLDPKIRERYHKLRAAIGVKDLDSEITDWERGQYATLREGTKLILNSASGAGDATFESNIRMNNQIISMRIIGQLFSWRIGQAQTIEGARITSTNTDGLYSVLDPEINNPVLERESAQINVEIEPEPLYLISKDTNNRIELTPPYEQAKPLDLTMDGKYAIAGASGGTLACRRGPVPTKSLAHPAIIDWAMTEYLIKAGTNQDGLSLGKPFDQELGREILDSVIHGSKQFPDDAEKLRMFQNVLASSDGSQMYNFAFLPDDDTPIPLQHYNRVFIMRDGTPDTFHMQKACIRVITEAVRQKRIKDEVMPQQHDERALMILKTQGVKDRRDIPDGKEAAISKITNLEDSWYMRIENRDLSNMTDDERHEIIENLDIDKYLLLFQDCFEKNWRNELPETPDDSKDEDACHNTVPSDDDGTQDVPLDICGDVPLDVVFALKGKIIL